MDDDRPAGIYCRISSDRAGESVGVRRQEAACRTVAEQKGWSRQIVYVDNDRSAFLGGVRPAYERLLIDLRSGHLQGVVTWDADRLHRSTLELEDFIRIIRDVDAQVVTVTAGPADFGSATGRLQARIKGTIAAYESDHRRERVAAAHKTLAAAGRWPGGAPPYGYDLYRDNHGRPLQDGRMRIVRREAAVIREAARRVLNGESLYRVCSDFNTRKIPTAKGSPWRSTTLRNILINPTVAGWRKHKGVVVTKGQWSAILDQQTHERLVAELAAVGRRVNRAPEATGRQPRKRLLTTGLARCGHCGTTLKGRSHHGRVVYDCHQGPDFGGCGRTKVAAVALEICVVEQVLARLDSDQTDTDTDALDVALNTLTNLHIDGAITSLAWLICQEGMATASLDLPASGPPTPRSVALFRSRPVDWQFDQVNALIEHVTVERPSRAGSRFDPSRITIHWRSGEVTRPALQVGLQGVDTDVVPCTVGRQLGLLPAELCQVDDGRVRVLYLAGHTIDSIADALGSSCDTVSAALKRTGTQARPTGHFQVDDRQVARLYSSGLTQSQVADQLGISDRTVRTSLRRSGTPVRKAGNRMADRAPDHHRSSARVVGAGVP